MLLACDIQFILYLTREKKYPKLKLKHSNSKCAHADCETSLVNCALGSVKGERVILQVQCRG